MHIFSRNHAATVCVIGGLIAFASSAHAGDDAAFAANDTIFTSGPIHRVTIRTTRTVVPSGSVMSSPTTLEISRRPRNDQKPAPTAPPSGETGPDGLVYTEVHGGFQEPDRNSGTQAVFGTRVATLLGRHVAIGGMVDWSHHEDAVTERIGTGPGPGGMSITTHREHARSSADLVPILGFLHFSMDNRRLVVPYVGVAGGYELLFLQAEDLTTGSRYEATFGGWGWQTIGGFTIRLSRHMRLSAEAFRNYGEVTRDSEDLSGQAIRETVNVEGTGARFGLSFGY